MDDRTYEERVTAALCDADFRYLIPTTVQHLDEYSRTIIKDHRHG